MSRHALITGGNGFIGSHLTVALVRAGWKVTHLLRESSVNPPLLLPLLSDISQYRLDTLEGALPSQISDIVAKELPDVTVHLATKYCTEHSSNDIPELIHANLLFGTALAEAVSQIPSPRFLNISSSWQHFNNRPRTPNNLYAATKDAFCSILNYYADSARLKVMDLTLFDTYGPDDPRKKIFSLLRAGTPLALSPGEQLLDLLYIDDVIEALRIAIEQLLEEGGSPMTQYSLGSGSPLSLRRVIEEFDSLRGYQSNVEWGARPYRAREIMIPYSPHPVLPEWQPRVSLQQGLKLMINSWEKLD